MIRYAMILILLCCVPSVSAAIEPHINDTVWVTTSNDIRICQLPPGASGCVAMPPYACREIEERAFVILDPEGLPLISAPFTHVNYFIGDDACSQPINSTILNLARLYPTNSPNLWIFVIGGVLVVWFMRRW